MARLIPPTSLPLSEWSKQINLPAGTAKPGPFRPYAPQAALMDAFLDPGDQFKKIVLRKSARSGFSLSLILAIMGIAVQDPSPIMLVMPTESQIRRFMSSELLEIVQANPDLLGPIFPPITSSTHDKSTQFHRFFPGGELYAVPGIDRHARAHSARYLLIDEVDALPPSKEGADIIRLFETRTATFRNSKIIVGGTPTDAETSLIEAQYQASDKRVWMSPCPGCGDDVAFEFENIKWDSGRPETAHMVTPCCGTIVEDGSEKMEMVNAGRFVVTDPTRSVAGFHVSALTSPLASASWANIVDEFLRVKHDAGLLQPWQNLLLGKPFKLGAHGDVTPAILAERKISAGMDNIPEDVSTIGMAVDVQLDSLQALVLGFAPSRTIVLDKIHIPGSRGSADGESWKELLDYKRRWRDHPLGGKIRPSFCGIDTGAFTQEVYDVIAPRQGAASDNLIALKGTGSPGKERISRVPKRMAESGVYLYHVGAREAKDAAYNQLARKGGEGAIYFNEALPEDVFDQLCGEVRQYKILNGKKVFGWFPRSSSQRVEDWDCLNYTLALSSLMNIQHEANLAKLKSGGSIGGTYTMPTRYPEPIQPAPRKPKMPPKLGGKR